MLIDAGVLRQPLLYLSLFFKQHRAEYYRLLSLVRETGDWEALISFFLEGVTETANAAVDSAHQLLALVKRDEARIFASLRARPVAKMAELCTRASVTFPTASKAIEQLITLGIAREITGKKRDRVLVYDGYPTGKESMIALAALRDAKVAIEQAEAVLQACRYYLVAALQQGRRLLFNSLTFAPQ
jgi:hypothetical protein